MDQTALVCALFIYTEAGSSPTILAGSFTEEQIKSWVEKAHHVDVITSTVDSDDVKVRKLTPEVPAARKRASTKNEGATKKGFMGREYTPTDGPISASVKNRPNGSYFIPIHSHSPPRSHA